MKRAFIVAALILALAVPAMAADLSVSGKMRVRGFYQDNPSLLNASSNAALAEDSRAWYDFRIRPEFKIKVNDNININTRVRLFNNERFGQAATTVKASTAAAAAGLNDDASWDRGWAAIKTPYGMFEIGRMTGGLWGHDIFDVERAADRIKHTMPLGNFTLIGIIEKNVETDAAATAAIAQARQEDADSDAYYLAGLYKMENITIGLLYGYARTTSTLATQTTADHLWLPTLTAKFGNFGLRADGHFRNGTQENDAANTDRDRTGAAFWAEGTFAFGPLTPLLGYGWASGDGDLADRDDEQGSRWGTEFTPLVILTDVDALVENAAVQNAALTGRGYRVVYGGANYNLTESLMLTGLVARGWVDEQQGAADDVIGTEFDLKVLWKVMPNLTYEVLFGWLNTGDLWKTVLGNVNIDDTWTLYHKMEIAF